VRALWVAGMVLLGAAPGVAQQGDRWQITLDSGTILWDLRLVKLAGDTLVVRRADSTYAFPIAQVDELRLVRKAQRSITPEAGRYGGVLGGGDDVAYRLTLYDLAERRQILRQVFQEHPPASRP
jgi:hypothetical protein